MPQDLLRFEKNPVTSFTLEEEEPNLFKYSGLGLLGHRPAKKIQLPSQDYPAWNSLPATIAETPDLVHFKQGLSSLTF